MHQIIYTSEAAPGLNSEEVFRIVEQSAYNNPGRDITGFLIFRDGRFLQLIEGPLNKLEELLEALRGDPRHHSLKVVDQRPVADRSFGRWRMRRVGEAQPALDELEGMMMEESQGRLVPEAVRDFLAYRRAA